MPRSEYQGDLLISGSPKLSIQTDSYSSSHISMSDEYAGQEILPGQDTPSSQIRLIQSDFNSRGIVERDFSIPREQDSLETTGCCSIGGFFAKVYFYIQHALREASKRKCQYFLGFLAVFLVVFVAGAALSVSSRAPAIFLNQAEKESGQIDFIIQPQNNRFAYVNYTQAEAMGEKYPYLSQTASRYTQYSPSTMYHHDCVKMVQELGFDTAYDSLDNSWMYLGDEKLSVICEETNYESCLSRICSSDPLQIRAIFPTLIDSTKEKSIGIGREWTVDTIPPGHAVISAELALEMGLKIDDTVFVTVDTTSNDEDALVFNSAHIYKTLVTEYIRTHLPEEDVKQYINRNTTDILQATLNSFAAVVELPVKIFDIIDEPMGKFPNDDLPHLLIMEFEHYIPYLVSKLNPSLALKDLEHMAKISTPQFVADDCPVQILPWSLKDLLSKTASLNLLQQFSTEIMVNMPGDRVSPYLFANYAFIHSHITDFGSSLAYRLGFVNVKTTPLLLEQIAPLKMFSMFLDLILSIVLTILFVLAFMLIYSLLTISIESRTFELGVHRMTGIKRRGIIEMLFMQALSYSIPGIIVGLILAQVVTSAVMRVFENTLHVPIDSALTTPGIVVAIVLGIVLPIVASIFPLKDALSQNLHDVLDSEHSKQGGVEFTIERSQDNTNSFAMLVVGCGMAIFGFCIYYLLPLALLSMNLALFFNIFFAILLGILFGLVLLSFNIQHLVERVVVYCFLFWEKRFIPEIVLKNLVSHKTRNRKTAMMYAVSLGFILFIVMALTTELKNSSAAKAKEYGGDIIVEFSQKSTDTFVISKYDSSTDKIVEKKERLRRTFNGEFLLEKLLFNFTAGRQPVEYSSGQSNDILSHQVQQYQQYSYFTNHFDIDSKSGNNVDPDTTDPRPIVEDWSWISTNLVSSSTKYDEFRSSNPGRSHQHSVNILAVSPLYDSVAFDDYLNESLRDRTTQLTMTEQLYTVRGSQSAIFSAALSDYYNIKTPNPIEQTIDTKTIMNVQNNSLRNLTSFTTNAIGSLESLAGLEMTKFYTNSNLSYVTSFPALLSMSNSQYTDTSNLEFQKVIIRLRKDITKAERRELVSQLTALQRTLSLQGVKIKPRSQSSTNNSNTETMLLLIFGFAALLCMILCMFSLIASMYSNIYESAKEIGVLRSIGLTAGQVTRIYVYEAFALVMASSLLGIIIGGVIGWSIILFRVLFTQLPLQFEFPWSTVVVVVIGAVICSFVAAFSPIRTLNRKKISNIFRTFY